MALAVGSFAVATPRLEAYRSLKPLVSQVKPALKEGDVLVTYRDFFNGVAFYTGRRVAVVRNFGELDFGRKLAGDANRWFLPNAAAMFKWLEGSRRIFVFCYKGALARPAGRGQAQRAAHLQVGRGRGQGGLQQPAEKVTERVTARRAGAAVRALQSKPHQKR